MKTEIIWTYHVLQDLKTLKTEQTSAKVVLTSTTKDLHKQQFYFKFC